MDPREADGQGVEKHTEDKGEDFNLGEVFYYLIINNATAEVISIGLDVRADVGEEGVAGVLLAAERG